MSAPEKNPRLEKVSHALEGLLADGDDFYISYSEEEGVMVEEGDFLKVQRFRETHPRLYGRLLSIHEQMEGGCGLIFAGFFLTAMVCLGLNIGWFDDWLGGAAEKMNSWWFFLLLFATSFVITNQIQDWQARAVYREGREELISLLAAENLDRDLVLTLLQEDSTVGNVLRQLKLDRDSFPSVDKDRS